MHEWTYNGHEWTLFEDIGCIVSTKMHSVFCHVPIDWLTILKLHAVIYAVLSTSSAKDWGDGWISNVLTEVEGWHNPPILGSCSAPDGFPCIITLEQKACHYSRFGFSRYCAIRFFLFTSIQICLYSICSYCANVYLLSIEEDTFN